MQLVAYMEGERVDATRMAHDPWRALTNRPEYRNLVLLECGLRAKRVTRQGRQFFAHWPKIECTISHKSETEQHMMMKLALLERINSTPGWRAEVEYVGPNREWIADVMAISESGRRLAFEVQLSAQNEDDYIRRSQRYFEERIGPIWVVPRNPHWRLVKLPLVVTGFGKTSVRPARPDELMDNNEYQPMYRTISSVGDVVDRFLRPDFRWTLGTPQQQRQKHLAEAEAKRIWEEEAPLRAQRAAEALAEKRRVEAEILARKTEKFVQAAQPASEMSGTPAIPAGVPTWASAVTCPQGHPVLIWTVKKPPGPAPTKERWSPENYANVRRHISSWLEASGNPIKKADIVQLKGSGHRQGFACAACRSVIQSRLVAALPAEKWSIVAGREGHYQPSDEELQERKPLSASKFHGRPKREEHRLPKRRSPRVILEDHPQFIGPKRRPLWTTDARTAEEIAERQAAKDRRAAHLRAIYANPRYQALPNGFRFKCTDCGGMFEDGYEGIHAQARCLTGSGRSKATETP